MRSRKIHAAGHEFELKYSLWSGQEEVYCDGRLVGSKRSFYFVTPYTFTLEENGEQINYEVNLITSMTGQMGYIIRRNGIAVAHEP